MNVIAIIALCSISYAIGWKQGRNPTFFQRKKALPSLVSVNKREIMVKGKVVSIQQLREKQKNTKNK